MQGLSDFKVSSKSEETLGTRMISGFPFIPIGEYVQYGNLKMII